MRATLQKEVREKETSWVFVNWLVGYFWVMGWGGRVVVVSLFSEQSERILKVEVSVQGGLGGCGQSTDRKLRRICGSSDPGLLGNKGQGEVRLGSAQQRAARPSQHRFPERPAS